VIPSIRLKESDFSMPLRLKNNPPLKAFHMVTHNAEPWRVCLLSYCTHENQKGKGYFKAQVVPEFNPKKFQKLLKFSFFSVFNETM
jgi:hypothetical protein